MRYHPSDHRMLYHPLDHRMLYCPLDHVRDCMGHYGSYPLGACMTLLLMRALSLAGRVPNRVPPYRAALGDLCSVFRVLLINRRRNHNINLDSRGGDIHLPPPWQFAGSGSPPHTPNGLSSLITPFMEGAPTTSFGNTTRRQRWTAGRSTTLYGLCFVVFLASTRYRCQ